MNQYLIDTKYASENLLLILNKERDSLNDKLLSRKSMITAEKDLFESMKKHGFTAEGVMDLYGFNKASDKLRAEVEDILNFVVANTGSLAIIAGAVLQIAKQGISINFKSLKNCPVGRTIGRESIKNIIWQGRNQAMHFEEGNYRNGVINCFKNLEMDFGNRFKLADKNLAYDVLTLLGWESYSAYERDMSLILK